MKTVCIIPAGGKGIRSGFPAPKQYIKFNDKELIAYTIEVFEQNPHIDEIITAVSPEYRELLIELRVKYKFEKLTKIVHGGKERQNSVHNALIAAKLSEGDLVCIHDAARPMLQQEILTKAILTAKTSGTAVVCLKGRDTLIEVNDHHLKYLDRSKVFYVQTPQVFQYTMLMEAMEKAEKDDFIGTDESMLVQRIGNKINLVEGSLMNFKITTKEDVELFNFLCDMKRN